MSKKTRSRVISMLIMYELQSCLETQLCQLILLINKTSKMNVTEGQQRWVMVSSNMPMAWSLKSILVCCIMQFVLQGTIFIALFLYISNFKSTKNSSSKFLQCGNQSKNLKVCLSEYICEFGHFFLLFWRHIWYAAPIQK